MLIVPNFLSDVHKMYILQVIKLIKIFYLTSDEKRKNNAVN